MPAYRMRNSSLTNLFVLKVPTTFEMHTHMLHYLHSVKMPSMCVIWTQCERAHITHLPA